MRTAVWTAIAVLAGAVLAPMILVAGILGYAVYSPAAVLGVIGLVLAFVRPFWGYLLFLVLLPIRSEDYALAEIGGATIRIADVVALAVFLGWLLFSMTSERRLPVRKTAVDVPLIFWASFTILTGIYAVSKASALSKALQLVYALILFYMFYDLTRQKEDLRPILWGWMIGGAVISSTTVIDYLQGTTRAQSALDVNQLANAEYLDYMAFLGIGLLLALKNLWARLLMLGLIGLAVTALLVNESRGAQVAFVVCAVFIVFAWPPFRRLLKWIPTAVAVTLVPVAVVLVAFNINPVAELRDAFDRWNRLIRHPTTDFGVKFRLDLWSAAWEAFLRVPLTGFGIGSLGEKIKPYIPVLYPETQILHNLYLEMLVTLGVFGFLLFCWFMGKVIWLTWRMWRTIPRDEFYFPLMTGALAVLLSQWVGWLAFGQIIENRVFWTALSLPFAIAHLANGETPGDSGNRAARGRSGRRDALGDLA